MQWRRSDDEHGTTPDGRMPKYKYFIHNLTATQIYIFTYVYIYARHKPFFLRGVVAKGLLLACVAQIGGGMCVSNIYVCCVFLLVRKGFLRR